jgi:hypothetical protein
MGQGSIFGAVALSAALLLAVIAIAWGAMNLTATKNVAHPVPAPAPTLLDRGGRETGVQSSPASILDRGGRGGYFEAITPGLGGRSAADSAARHTSANVYKGSTSSAGASSAAHPTRSRTTPTETTPVRVPGPRAL